MKTVSKEKRAKRTDCHRPGAIVPTDYEYVLSYDLGGVDEPPWGMQELRAMCKAIQWGRGETKMFGHGGVCGVCGANFRYGDLWEHIPTKALVHLGHDCADKYQLVADREDWLAQLECLKRGRAARLEALRRDQRLEDYYRSDPSMRGVLEVEHEILHDMKVKVRQWGQLSPKQVIFAVKLASEAWCPERPQVEEIKAPAPLGRTVIEGVVVSKKAHESQWGITEKMVVKVATEQGVWLCYGSALPNTEIGAKVRFRATLEAGREAHFAFFKRPHDLRAPAQQ